MERTPVVLLFTLAVICFADALSQFSHDKDQGESYDEILQNLPDGAPNPGLYLADNEHIRMPDADVLDANYIPRTSPVLAKRIDYVRHNFAGIGKRIDPGIRFAGLGKRTLNDREKKERKLAAVLQNLILKLNSDEARGSSVRGARGGFISLSGESSGSLSSEMESTPRDNGSKRRYGNIFTGPIEEIHRTVRRRPRQRRKYRVDPVMFWLGIGR